MRESCDYSQRRRRKRFDWRNNSAESIDSRSLGQISHELVTFVSVVKRFLLPRISHVDPRLLHLQLVSLDCRTVSLGVLISPVPIEFNFTWSYGKLRLRKFNILNANNKLLSSANIYGNSYFCEYYLRNGTRIGKCFVCIVHSRIFNISHFNIRMLRAFFYPQISPKRRLQNPPSTDL